MWHTILIQAVVIALPITALAWYLGKKEHKNICLHDRVIVTEPVGNIPVGMSGTVIYIPETKKLLLVQFIDDQGRSFVMDIHVSQLRKHT